MKSVETAPMHGRAAADAAADGAAVLVVDPAVAGAAVLLDGRSADLEVLHLTPDGHPLEQIARYLAGRSGIGALHILGHGEPGALLLAGDRIDLPALAGQPGVLADIAGAVRLFGGDGVDTLYDSGGTLIVSDTSGDTSGGARTITNSGSEPGSAAIDRCVRIVPVGA